MTPESSTPPGSPAVPGMRGADVLELLVLGPPVLRWGEQEVRVRTRKAFALLVYLALTRIPQPREHLASLLWPDRDPASARNLLRTTLSQLRQHLGSAGGTTADAITLLHAHADALGREAVRWDREGKPSLMLDVELLEGAAADAEAELQAAARAYRGPFLEAVRFEDAPEFEGWVGAQRVYWQNEVERVLGHLTTLQLERRAFAEANASARHWLGLNPVSEPAYQTLMRALATAGDRAGALAVYETCRTVLRTELAVDPSPETVALAERLHHLPASSAPRPGPTDNAASQPALRTWRVSHAEDFPFVGREQEFAALVSAYQAARAGQVQVVVIEGEAGIGKTRLTDEFLRWATLEGADVLRGRGDETRGRLPYQLMVDAVRPRLARENAPEDLVAEVWLTELVRLFPELVERYPDLPAPVTLSGDEATGQGRLFEAIHQLILALAERARPEAQVLVYDDVQWADLATRDLLLYRLPRQRETGSPYLLLLTVRSEDLATIPELEAWLGALARQVPTTRLALGPLGEVETEQAIAAVLAEPSVTTGALGLGPWLYAQTEGQPFYLVETLRTLVDRRILVPQEDVAGSGQMPRFAIGPQVERLPRFVPGTVRQLIQGQLAGLSPPTQDVLAAVAVLGSEATFERLCQVAKLDERAGLSALDDLRPQQLVVEQVGDSLSGGTQSMGPARFGFSHDLVREVVYTEAGDTRRRIFHRRALDLLEGTTASAADLARHAFMAGLIEPAVRHSVEAGDAALAVFAARDAIGHYQRAQRLLASSDAGPPPGTTEQWAYVHVQLGRAYEWLGEWEQARTTYQALRAHAREVGDATLEGRALTRLALLAWFDVQDLNTARALAAEAIQVLDATENRELLAEAHWAASVLGNLAGDMEVARRHARRAEELGQAAGRREIVAGSLLMQGYTAAESGDWDESVAAFQHGVAMHAALAAEQPARLPRRGAGETPQRSALYPWMGPGDATRYLLGEALCAVGEGLTAISRGEPHRGIELGRNALHLGLESVNTEIDELARFLIIFGLVEVGHYEEALQVGRPVLHRAQAPGEPIVHFWRAASWARAQQAILDTGEAERAVTKALEWVEQLPISHWSVHHSRSLHCTTLALAGDWTGASEAARQAISRREIMQARLLPLDFARHYEIEALARGGNHELAQADVRRLEERLRTDGSDRRYWLVYHRMQAVVARWNDRPAEAVTHLEEALQLAQEMDLPGEAWQMAAEMATAYRQEGALAEAERAEERARAVIAALATDIKDRGLHDRFKAAALERARMLAT